MLAIVGHTSDELLGDRILRNLEYGERTTLGIALHQVVVGNTAGDDTQLMVGAIDILVIFALNSHLLQQRLLTGYYYITLAGKGGQKYPVTGLGIVVKLVLWACLVLHLNYGTTVCHTGGNTHQDGQVQILRHIESLLHHIVGLLLRAGLQGGNHGKLSVET